jgi:hypothetical protein
MWAVGAARHYGLENVHLEAWQIAHSWQRGSAQAQIVKPVLRGMSIASAGWSPATNGSVLGNVVYVEATDRNQLQAYRGKLKGSIVIYEKPAELMSQVPASGPYSGPEIQDPVPPERRTSSEQQNFDKDRRSFFREQGVAAVLYDAGKHNGLLSVAYVAEDFDNRKRSRRRCLHTRTIHCSGVCCKRRESSLRLI